MTFVDIPLRLKEFGRDSKDLEVLHQAMACRSTAQQLINEKRTMDALERTVEALRTMRDFSDFENTEFRALLVSVLFDLAEIHFELADYRQSEKDLEMLFRVLENLTRTDADRFVKYHVLAMALSTRLLRSRRKTLELLAKQQAAAGLLYDKVNSGAVNATEKLVTALRNVGRLLASTGDYRASMKFYAEAIKYSKKRTGGVNEKEVRMSLEMAEIMMRLRRMRPRARKLLEAVLPHAIALGSIELEEDILALMQVLDADVLQEPKWKAFLTRISKVARKFTNSDAEAPAAGETDGHPLLEQTLADQSAAPEAAAPAEPSDEAPGNAKEAGEAKEAAAE